MQDKKWHFDEPIVDVIRERVSVRTFKPEILSREAKTKLLDYIPQITGPFDIKVRLELIHNTDAVEKTGGKIGTYGVIKGAKSYLVGVVEKGDKNLEQLGYAFEHLILYATFLGLGTCWIGGTFKRSGFEKIVALKENEVLPIVSPVGYAASRRSLVDTAFRLMAGSKNRMQWQELFFNENLNTPLEEKDAQQYFLALDMVRLAPSASNKQPWRIVKEGNRCHFYLKRTKGYEKALGSDLQRIDMGIAMCHFEMTLKEMGITGRWRYIPGAELKNVEYTITWVENDS